MPKHPPNKYKYRLTPYGFVFDPQDDLVYLLNNERKLGNQPNIHPKVKKTTPTPKPPPTPTHTPKPLPTPTHTPKPLPTSMSLIPIKQMAGMKITPKKKTTVSKASS